MTTELQAHSAWPWMAAHLLMCVLLELMSSATGLAVVDGPTRGAGLQSVDGVAVGAMQHQVRRCRVAIAVQDELIRVIFQPGCIARIVVNEYLHNAMMRLTMTGPRGSARGRVPRLGRTGSRCGFGAGETASRSRSPARRRCGCAAARRHRRGMAEPVAQLPHAQALDPSTFLIIPVVACRHGTTAQRAAEAQVRRQGFSAELLAHHRIRFAESGVEALFPLAVRRLGSRRAAFPGQRHEFGARGCRVGSADRCP